MPLAEALPALGCAGVIGRVRQVAAGGLVRFAWQVGQISGGVIVMQLVQIAILPVLARLYGVGDFGRFGMMVAAVTILGTVLALRFDMGMLATRAPARTARLGALAVAVTLALAALLALLASPLAHLAGYEPGFVLAVLAAAMAYSLWQIAGNLAVREQRFGAVFRSRVAQSAGSVGPWLLLPALGLTTVGLPLGYTCGILAAVAVLGLPWHALRQVWRRPRLLWQLASRYRDFPRFSAPSALFNVIGQMQGAALLVGLAYGAEAAGLFFVAMRAVGTPIQVMTGALAQVYASRIAAPGITAEARWHLFFLLSVTMALLAVCLLVPLVVFGGPLFALVLGSEWHDAGAMAVWLALAFGTQLVASPVAHTLYVLERQRAFLLWDAARAVLVVGTVLACRHWGVAVEAAVAVLAVAQASTYALLWALVYHILRRELATTGARS